MTAAGLRWKVVATTFSAAPCCRARATLSGCESPINALPETTSGSTETPGPPGTSSRSTPSSA